MVHFTRACKTLLSENNKTRLTFEKQQEKNKNIICRPWSVRIEKNCALGLEHGPRPAASGRTQDLWHSFSQYGPPGRQIIYMSSVTFLTKIRDFAKVRSLFSRIGSSLFKYLKNFFQNESVKAVMAHTFPPGVRNGNAGVCRREIAVFDPQV